MIVVSDTSPLTNLAAVGQFGLLNRLYGRVYIAQGVWDELNAHGKRWPGRDEVAEAESGSSFYPSRTSRWLLPWSAIWIGAKRRLLHWRWN